MSTGSGVGSVAPRVARERRGEKVLLFFVTFEEMEMYSYAVPLEVVGVDEDREKITVRGIDGEERVVSTSLLAESVGVGDFVNVHEGYATDEVPSEEALGMIEYFRNLPARLRSS